MKRIVWAMVAVLFLMLITIGTGKAELNDKNNTITAEKRMSASGYKYFVPYYHYGSGFWTGIGISNCSKVNPTTFSATVYSCAGKVLATDTHNPLPANGQIAVTVASNLNATGWILINSQEELTGLCFFGKTYMADIPFVEKVAKYLIIPHIAQDNYWDTSVMICNPNNTPVTLSLTCYRQDGSSAATSSSILPAFSSKTYPLASTFNGLSTLTGKIEIKVTQGDGVAAFALYQNQKSGGNYFAGINAVETEDSPAAAKFKTITLTSPKDSSPSSLANCSYSFVREALETDPNQETYDILLESWCINNPALCGNYVDLGVVDIETVTSYPATGYLSDTAGFGNCVEVDPTHTFINKNRDGSHTLFRITRHTKPDQCLHIVDVKYRNMD